MTENNQQKEEESYYSVDEDEVKQEVLKHTGREGKNSCSDDQVDFEAEEGLKGESGDETNNEDNKLDENEINSQVEDNSPEKNSNEVEVEITETVEEHKTETTETSSENVTKSSSDERTDENSNKSSNDVDTLSNPSVEYQNQSEQTGVFGQPTPNKKANLHRRSDGHGIPTRLRPYIYHSETTDTYKLLSGKVIVGLSQTDISSITTDLNKYVDIAVDHGLIDEAMYVQNIIDTIKADKPVEKIETRELMQIETKILETNTEIEECLKYWDSQKELLDRELECSILELSAQLNVSISQLDSEWQSSKKQQLYSKPSSQLLNLRDMAKKLIKVKKFDELKKIGELISEKEKQEAKEAAERMNSDYRAADQRIHKKYEQEKAIIIQTHETKVNNLIRTKERTLRPIKQRLENLEKQRDMLIKQQKKSEAGLKAKINNTPRDSPKRQKQQLPNFINTPKLALPSINPIKREIKQTGSSANILRPKPQISRRLSNKSSSRNDIMPPQRFVFDQ